MAHRATSRDPWSLLDLAPGASESEVQRAWRRLASAHHPDVGGDPATFHELTAARDQLLGGRRRRAPAPVVVHRAGRVRRALRPLRRRIDRRRRPRVT